MAASQADYNAKVANQQFQMQQTSVNYDRLVAARQAQYAIQQQDWTNRQSADKQAADIGIGQQNSASTAMDAGTGRQNSNWNVNPYNPNNMMRNLPVNTNSDVQSQVLSAMIGNSPYGPRTDPTFDKTAYDMVNRIMVDPINGANATSNQTRQQLLQQVRQDSQGKGYSNAQLGIIQDVANKYADAVHLPP